MTPNERTVREILDLEYQMFQTVNTAQRAPCQDDPRGFALYRGAQFSAWSPDTLESYLADLQTARASGRNLLTEKYAHMDGLLPAPAPDALRDQIVRVQRRWQEQLGRRYPKFMARARPVGTGGGRTTGTSFETYLAGELATYSRCTLSRLHRDTMTYEAAGKNMAEEIYVHLVQQLGYATIQETETSLTNATGGDA